MMKYLVMIILMLVGLASLGGCAGAVDSLASRPARPGPAQRRVINGPLALKDESRCAYPANFPTLPRSAWNHRGSRVIASLGQPHHFARDAVTTTGTPTRLEAKFTYGALSKDLEGEPVRVLMIRCDGWTRLGRSTTNHDGRVYVRLDNPPAPGVYRLLFQQLTDGTYTTSKLWVAPPATKVALFDIDGTLTTADVEAFRELSDDMVGDGAYSPRAYPGGKELSQYYADRGYLVVYLTGRPYWMGRHTRSWLRDQGMASGVVRMAPTHGDFWPSQSGVGAFKRREIDALIEAGLTINAAHGNTITDLGAYVGAGILKKRIWLIGDHTGAQGTSKVGRDWRSLLTRFGVSDESVPSTH